MTTNMAKCGMILSAVAFAAGCFPLRVLAGDATTRFGGIAGHGAIATEANPGKGARETVKGTQTIAFEEIGPQVWTNWVTLHAEASSGLPVEFEVEGPAECHENEMWFRGVGIVTVTARQPGDENWEAAEPVVRTFAVGKAAAAVRLTGLEQEYDRGEKRVTVETEPCELRVVVTYDGQEEAPRAAGRYAVAATVDEDLWEGGATGTLVVAKGRQSITFEEIDTQVATNRLSLNAEASSDRQVSYEVEGPAEMDSWNSMHFLGTGTVWVTAKQEGDDNWEAAVPVSFSFEVVKAVAEVMLSGLEQVYDGTPKSVEVTTEPAEVWMAHVRYDGVEAAPVDAGEYAVEVEIEDEFFEGGATGTLRVAKASLGEREPGDGEVPEGGLSVFDTTAVYDGWSHPEWYGIEQAFAAVMNVGEEFTVEYAVTEEDPRDGEAEWMWSGAEPQFTDACAATVWYRVRSRNHADFVHAMRVTVTPRPVEVRVWGARELFAYDGKEQVAAGYWLEAEEELFDADAMTRFLGTAEARRTDAGTTVMGLAGGDFECTDANFDATYIIEEDGWVEVTPGVIDPGAVFGAERPVCEKEYDGSEQAFEMAVAFGEPWQVLYADGEGGFGEAAPTLTHAAGEEMEVAFRFTSANYETYEGTAGFRITQAANEWVAQPGIAGWTEGEAASEPTGEARFGAMEAAYRARGAAVESETGEPPTAAGLYVARFWVAETADYAGVGLDETCEVEFEIAAAGGETTQETEVPVPLSWLEPYVEEYGGGDYEEAGKAVGKNGYVLWESYVAGLDPDDPDSRLTPVINFLADGTPDVTWDPDLSEDELPRAYTVVGTDVLGKAVEDWTPVTEENIGEMRYFAVGVEFAK